MADEDARRRILIRADAGRDIGFGHLLRMRSLAEALARSGAPVGIVGHGVRSPADTDPPWSIAELDEPSADESDDLVRTSELLGSPGPDVLIVDHYGLGEDWERGIADRSPGTRIAAIDDLPARTHAVDVLVDPNLGPLGPRAAAGTAPRILAGTAYAPLGEEYRDPASERTDPLTSPNVLVTLGGGRSGIVVRIAEALIMEPRLRHIRFEFVVPDPGERTTVAGILDGHPNCTVHGRVPTMRPLLERADLVVGAGGTSAWQRLRLGLPSVTVTLADNQLRTGRALHDLGLARWVTPGIGAAAVIDAVVEALDDERLRRRAAVHGPLLVDGRGAERIALALLPPSQRPVMRPLADGDAAALLAMANDPVTRAGSREPNLIRPQEHLDWFRRMRASAGSTWWVAEVDDLVVGQIRFSALGEGWELNYGLDAAARGHGWSTPMVREGLRGLAAEGRDGPVFAVVHVDNEASRRSLATLGFAPDDAGRALAAGARVPDGFTAYLLAEGRGTG